ncbi:MAG: AgmX/PglI C-terminal domain-containing protein [Pseudomonadota bacterium]
MTLLTPMRKDSTKSSVISRENANSSLDAIILNSAPQLNTSTQGAVISNSFSNPFLNTNHQDPFYKILKRCLVAYFILGIAVPFLAPWAEKILQEQNILVSTEPVELKLAFTPVPTPVPEEPQQPIESQSVKKPVEKPVEKTPEQPAIAQTAPAKSIEEPKPTASKAITPKVVEKAAPSSAPVQSSQNSQTAVRERMQNTGLLAMGNQLSDLSNLTGETTSATGTRMKTQTSSGAMASASGEIDNITVSDTGGTATSGSANSNFGKPSVGVDRLAATGLSSAGFSDPNPTSNQSSAMTASSGTSNSENNSQNSLAQDSIRLIFEQNKTAIYSIYHRELRQVPNLKGRVVFDLTIQPDGRVTQAKIISSELNHPSLEQKLTQRVTLMRFQPADGVTKTQYSMDFLANV